METPASEPFLSQFVSSFKIDLQNVHIECSRFVKDISCCQFPLGLFSFLVESPFFLANRILGRASQRQPPALTCEWVVKLVKRRRIQATCVCVVHYMHELAESESFLSQRPGY